MRSERLIQKSDIRDLVSDVWFSLNLYSYENNAEFVTDPDFHEKGLVKKLPSLFQSYEGRKSIYLCIWLKSLLAMFSETIPAIKMTDLSVDLNNLHEVILPTETLLNLKINLSGFTIENLQTLFGKIAQRPIHHVIFTEATHLPIAVITNLIDQLLDVDIIEFKNTSLTELMLHAQRLTARNHLIKYFGLKNQSNIWRSIIEKWSSLFGTMERWSWHATNHINKIFYHSQTERMYIGHWEYKDSISAAAGVPSNRQLDEDIIRKFEFFSLINTCIYEMGELFFEKMLENLNPQLNLATSRKDIELVLNTKLTPELLQKLAVYVTQESKQLKFVKLNLYVDVTLLTSASLLQLLIALRASTVLQLELSFSLEELTTNKDEIEDKLIQLLIAKPDYPIIISSIDKSNYIDRLTKENIGAHRATSFTRFEEKLIECFHQKPLAMPQENIVTVNQEKKSEEKDQEYSLFDRKIILKNLALKKQGNLIQNSNDYVRLEVQHTEVMQQVEQKQEQVDITIEVEHEIGTGEIFSGELIDFDKFNVPIYGLVASSVHHDAHVYSIVLETEFFANVPKGIKYFSKAAAMEIANNLMMYMTLNISNFPLNFRAKKTEIGELILDYDIYGPENKTNNFTPKALSHEPLTTIYDIELNEEKIKKLIGDDQLFKAVCYERLPYYSQQDVFEGRQYLHKSIRDHFEKPITFTPRRLVNLWIKSGDAGIELFFKYIKSIDEKHPKFSSFLLKMYLNHFIHWDHFLTDDRFLKSLERIKLYHDIKLICLKKFLLSTGRSRHDLAVTIDAFDLFWDKLETLCAKHKADIDKINSDWHTLEDGNPIVYIERLLTILESARDFNEQLDCLAGLKLNYFGPYYAVKYEGLRVVSPHMLFNYDARAAYAGSFNPNQELYRQNLDDLYSLCEHQTIVNQKDFLTFAYRYMAQQSSGVNINTYITNIQHLTDKLNIEDTINIVFTSLFFLTHERFKNIIPVTDLFDLIKKIKPAFGPGIRRNLLELYKLDIKLSDTEGAVLLQQIIEMSPPQKTWSDTDTINYLNKLFSYMKQNKYAVFKCLDNCYQDKTAKWHFVQALDTAEYFAGNEFVAKVYKDDLLLFATLLNSDPKDSYFSSRADKKAANIRENLKLVKAYLLEAASNEKPNNLDYVIQTLIQSRLSFSWEKLLTLLEEIKSQAMFNQNVVDNILQVHQFTIRAPQVVFFARDNSSLKNDIIELIITFRKIKAKGFINTMQNLTESESEAESQQTHSMTEVLMRLSIAELQVEIAEAVKACGTLMTVTMWLIVKPIYFRIKNSMIAAHFNRLDELPIVKIFQEKITYIKDFCDYDDFEKINRIEAKARIIANLLGTIVSRDNFLDDAEKITALFAKLDFTKFDYEMLYALSNILADMPQRSYAGILANILSDNKIILDSANFLKLIDIISKLMIANLSSQAIEKLIPLASRYINHEAMPSLLKNLEELLTGDGDELLLNYLILNAKHDLAIPLKVCLSIKYANESDRDLIRKFFLMLSSVQLECFIKVINKNNDLTNDKILAIIAKSYAYGRANSNAVVDCADFAEKLSVLTPEDLKDIYGFLKTSALSAASFYQGLDERTPDLPFAIFLAGFEKAPFGVRDLDQQFSTAELERVINNSKDLKNNTRYTYQYRKQLMEAVLLINGFGRNLPVYLNKPAKDLTNLELKTLFQAVKLNVKLPLNDMQSWFYALGLMREAVYRATGEFPYLTQVVALVDSMLLGGDVISNIDTGQGKSLVDTMKGALLWLISDRVDVTTSSLVDAKRQIDLYGPFLQLLDIPFAPKSISAATDFVDFQNDGINFSTFSSLSLFLSRARVEGFAALTNAAKVSLVINESDHAILEERTIFRYAVTDGTGAGNGNEWVYYAINEFIDTLTFLNPETSALNDIKALRAYLHKYAKENNKSIRLINKFDDNKLLMWIESALITRYLIKENYHYVIPPEAVTKKINGMLRTTYAVKILLKDGKVSADTTYGNGMQQLLYAYLNTKQKAEKFVIETESNTIVSTNNKNLLEYYQSKDGLIWGSSGTVGSDVEILEQSKKYGFSFSKIEPHQKNIVVKHKPTLFDNETMQFKAITQLLSWLLSTDKRHIPLVFFKDIETAKRFFALLARSKSFSKTQLFLGVENEEEVIKVAATPGMITITTSALGRNTDILYDRALGMIVIQTCADSSRGVGQKDGRTGRQGSPGSIYYYLNKLDMAGKTIEQISASIDEQSAHERKFNEALYNIIGYLLAVVDNLTDAYFISASKENFLRQAWAKFTDDLEMSYREAKLNNSYGKKLFVMETLRLFNHTLQSNLKSESMIYINPDHVLQSLDKIGETHQNYNVSPRMVRISDCIPSEIIAYDYLSPKFAGSFIPISPSPIKAVLKHAFAAILARKPYQLDQFYLSYLNANPHSLVVIRAVHQEFLSDFLNQQIEQTNTTGFVQRWLGIANNLNKIASDQNYLFVFKTMTSLQGDSALVDIGQFKLLINTMLNQYLKNSWFINSSRKQAVATLKMTIANAKDVDALIAALSTSQTSVLQSDIFANKNSLWRRLKPLNYSGNSRFQNTVTDALVLMSNLTAKKLNPVMAQCLLSQLKTVTNNLEVLEPLLKQPDLDNFDQVVPSLLCNDQGNARVIAKSLDKSLQNDLTFAPNRQRAPRPAFFQYLAQAQRVEPSQPQTSPSVKLSG